MVNEDYSQEMWLESPKGSVPGHAQLESFNSDEEESINC